LALRLGHRESVDYDFFSNEKFEAGGLLDSLALLKGATVLDSKPNTLTVVVDRSGPVKVSFFGGMALGRVRDPERTDDGIVRVASLLDIGASKMKVILERIETKDYHDIYWLLEAGVKLPDMLAAAAALYRDRGLNNPLMSLRAVGYFGDGDLYSLPEGVKETLAKAAGIACQGDIPPMAKLPGGLAPLET